MYINYSSTKLTNEEFKYKPELKVPYHFGRNHPTPYCSDDKQIVSLWCRVKWQQQAKLRLKLKLESCIASWYVLSRAYLYEIDFGSGINFWQVLFFSASDRTELTASELEARPVSDKLFSCYFVLHYQPESDLWTILFFFLRWHFRDKGWCSGYQQFSIQLLLGSCCCILTFQILHSKLYDILKCIFFYWFSQWIRQF